MSYSDKTFSESIEDEVNRYRDEYRESTRQKLEEADRISNIANRELYESYRDIQIEEDKAKIKDEDHGEDTGKVAEYWNDAIDFVGGPDFLRAKEVKNGRLYDSRNKRSTIYDNWDRDSLIDEIKNIEEDPDAKHVFYNIKYYTGKDEYGNSTYAYKSGVDEVSAYNRYKEQLGDDVQIVFEKRFAGAEDAEHRLNQLNFEQGKTLATSKQEAYRANIGSFGSGYTEFTNEDDFGGHRKTDKDFNDAREESYKEYLKDYEYRKTIDDNSGFYEGVLKGGDYGDALQSGTMSLVGGIGDAIAGGIGYGFNAIGLRNDLDENNMFQTLKDNADRYAGYDRKSNTAAIKESVALFKSGNYVEALWNNKFSLAENVVESLPEMLAMGASIPIGGSAKVIKALNSANNALRVAQEAGDIAKVAKLTKEVRGLTQQFASYGEVGIKTAETINSMSLGSKIASAMGREAGFNAVVAKNTNNVIEDRIKNGDDDISIGEFTGILATQFLSTATDKLIFDDLVGDNKIINTLGSVFKTSSEATKKGVIHSVAKTAKDLSMAGATEGLQEYLQTWTEIAGQQLGVKGKTLSDVISDKKNQDEALGASLAGAVGGVAMHSASYVPNVAKKGFDTASEAISTKLKENNIHLEANEDTARLIKTFDDFNNEDYTPENKMLSLSMHFDSKSEHTIDYEGKNELIKNVIDSVGSDTPKGKILKQYITQKIADSIYDSNTGSEVESLSTARELKLDIDTEVYKRAVASADNLMNEIFISEYGGKDEILSSVSHGSDSIADRVDSPSEGSFKTYKPKPIAKEPTDTKVLNPMYGRFDAQILALDKQIQSMEKAKIDSSKTKKYRDLLFNKNSQKTTDAKKISQVIEEIADIGFVNFDGTVNKDKRSISQYKESLPLSVSSLGYDNNNILKRFNAFTESRLSKASVSKSNVMANQVIDENIELFNLALDTKSVIINDKSLTSKQKKESIQNIDKSIDNLMSSNVAMLDRSLGREETSLESLSVNSSLKDSYVVSNEATTQLILDDISNSKTFEDIQNIKHKINGSNGSTPIYFNNKDGNEILLSMRGREKELLISNKDYHNKNHDSKNASNEFPYKDVLYKEDYYGTPSFKNHDSKNASNEFPYKDVLYKEDYYGTPSFKNLPQNDKTLRKENNISSNFGKIHFVKNMKDWIFQNKNSQTISDSLFDATMKALLSSRDNQIREDIARRLSGYNLNDEQIQTLYDVINYNKEDYTSEPVTHKKEDNSREELVSLMNLRNALQILSEGLLNKSEGLKSDELRKALEEANKQVSELKEEIKETQNSLTEQNKQLKKDSSLTKDESGVVRNLYLKALKIVKSLYSNLLKLKADTKELDNVSKYLSKIVDKIDKDGKIYGNSIHKTVSSITVLQRMIDKKINNMNVSNSDFEKDIKFVSGFENSENAKIKIFAKNAKVKLTDKNSTAESKEKLIKKFRDYVEKNKTDKPTEPIVNVDKTGDDNKPAESVVLEDDQPTEPTGNIDTDQSNKDDQPTEPTGNIDTDQSNVILAEWNTKEYRKLLDKFKVNFNNLKVLLSNEKNETSNEAINKTLNMMKQVSLEKLRTLEFDLQTNVAKSNRAITDKVLKIPNRQNEIRSLRTSLDSLRRRVLSSQKKGDIAKFHKEYVNMLKSEIRLQELTGEESKPINDELFRIAVEYSSKLRDENNEDNNFVNLLVLKSKYNSKMNMLKAKALDLLSVARRIVSGFFEQKKKILLKIQNQEREIARIDEIIETFNRQGVIEQEDMDFLENKFRAKQVKDQIDTRNFSNGEKIANWFNKHNPSALTLFAPSNNPIARISSILTSGKAPSIIEQEFLLENISDSSVEKMNKDDFVNIGKLSNVVLGFAGSAHNSVSIDNGSIISKDPNIMNIANLFTRKKDNVTAITEPSVNRATKLVNGFLLSNIHNIKYDIMKMDDKDIADNFSIKDKQDILNFRKDIAKGIVPIASIEKDMIVELKNLIGLKIHDDSDEKNKRLYDATLKGIIRSVAKSNDMFNVETKQYADNKKFTTVQVNDMFMNSNFTAEEISEIRNSFSKLSYIVGNRRRGKPTSKPQKVPETARNSELKLSDSVKKKLEKLNNTPYNFSKNFEDVAVMYENDKEATYKLFGYYSEDELRDMTIEDYISAVSNNEQTVREVDALYKYYKQFGEQDFYLPYNVTKSNRTQIFSEITPMDSKIHREFVVKKSFTKEISPSLNNFKEPIDMSDDNFTDEEMFEIALSEAFDLDPDKKSRFQIFKDIRNIVDIYGTSGIVVKSKDYDWLKQFVENDFTDLSLIPSEVSRDLGRKAIHGAIELRKLHQNKKNGIGNLTHDLTIEADAITSGMGLLSMQSGMNESNRRLLEKTGILTDEQLEDRTRYAKKLLSKKHNIPEDRVTMSMPSLIEAGDYHYELISNGKSNELEGITDEDLYLDLYKTIGSDVMDMGFKKDTVDESTVASKYFKVSFDLVKNKLEEKAKKGGLKYFRKLAKSPVMVNGYGASINSIKRNIKEEVLYELFLESLRSNDRKFAHSIILEADARKNKKAKNLKGEALIKYNNEVIDKYWENISQNFDIPEEYKESIDLLDKTQLARYAIVNNKLVDQVLQEQSNILLGDKFEASFDKRMSAITNYRKTLQHLDIIHAETFKFLLEKEVGLAKKENIRELSFEERRDIANRASNEPLDALEEEYKQKQKDRANKLSFAQLEGIVAKMNENGYGYTLELFDRLQEFYKESEIDIEGKDRSLITDGYGNVLSVETRAKEFIANFRAYPTISIHNLDDAVMYKALIDNDFSSIYDAIIFPSHQGSVNDTVGNYNTNIVSTTRDNSILDATVNKLSNMIKRIKELGKEDEFYQRFNMFDGVKAKEVLSESVIPVSEIQSERQKTFTRMVYADNSGAKVQFTKNIIVNDYIIGKNQDGTEIVVDEVYIDRDNKRNILSSTTYKNIGDNIYSVSFASRPVNVKKNEIDNSGKKLLLELGTVDFGKNPLEFSDKDIALFHNKTMIAKIKDNKKYSSSYSVKEPAGNKKENEVVLKNNALKQALDQSKISGSLGESLGKKLTEDIENIQNDRKELYLERLHVNHMAIVGTHFTTVEPADSEDVNLNPDNSIVKEIFDKAGKAYTDGLIEYLKAKYKDSNMLRKLEQIGFSAIVSPMANDGEYMKSLSKDDSNLIKEYVDLGLEANRTNEYIATYDENRKDYFFVKDFDSKKPVDVIYEDAISIIKKYLDDPDMGC